MGTKKEKSSIFGFIFSKLFLIQLALALVIFVALAAITLHLLKDYTNHGEFVEVPDLKDLSLDEACVMLEIADLKYEIIDSVYLPQSQPGTIVEQVPVAKERIKKHREIYLVINSFSKPLISLPDVRDLSGRNAKATLESRNFVVSEIEYVPSEYRDLVKDVKLNGRILTPGEKIPHGTKLSLVVGEGLTSEDEIPIPSLRGLSYEEAIQKINTENLHLRSAQFDGEPKNSDDSLSYVVYKQNPIKSTPIRIGSSVNIWLTKDKKHVSLSKEEEEYIVEETIDSTSKAQEPADIEDFFK